jgi:serine kinase of HPr protein (carbohydrate metabolism regulator)
MGTIHASAVLVGPRAVLIRGASGAGKSRLALRLIEAASVTQPLFTRLVSDDRSHISAAGGRLMVRPPAALAGLLEVRGLGIRRLPYEPVAVVGWVVDLGEKPERLPDDAALRTVVEGVTLPRFAFPPCADPLPVLLAALRARPL